VMFNKGSSHPRGLIPRAMLFLRALHQHPLLVKLSRCMFHRPLTLPCHPVCALCSLCTALCARVSVGFVSIHVQVLQRE
jgi:hypothetical protein